MNSGVRGKNPIEKKAERQMKKKYSVKNNVTARIGGMEGKIGSGKDLPDKMQKNKEILQ